MRLPKVDHGQAIPKRLLLAVMGVVMGGRAPGVIRTLMYRPEFFGGHARPLIQSVMRGSNHWSAEQTELFAGFVSARNQCPF
jgi:hypothetical protein